MDRSSVAYHNSWNTREDVSGGLADGLDGDRGLPASLARHSTEAEPDVVAFWHRMALAAPAADAPRPGRIPVPAELHPVLQLLEVACRGSRHGGISVPSAGALYPYEHAVVAEHAGELAVFAVDAARRSVHLQCRIRPAEWPGGLPLPGPGRTLLLTNVRPWLSMRKYGDRGYLYAHLDAAHLSTHLLCLAQSRFERTRGLTAREVRPLDQVLGLPGRCRFVHSALWLDSPTAPSSAPRESWACVDQHGAPLRQTLPEHPEQQCWQRLPARPQPGTPVADSGAGSFTAARVAAAGPVAGQLAVAAPRRRSAKDFTGETVPVGDVRRALRATGTRLPWDLPVTGTFGITVLARRVAGLAAGAYRVYDGTLAPEPVAEHVVDGDELVRICMGQEHLRHAAAAVVFHAPRDAIFQLGIDGVDAALLRAGVLAHLLCLGAADAGLAITTIGGFDAAGWHRVSALPQRDEALYVALVGQAGVVAVKLDRLQRAYAHDEA
ncbi:nitroreductase family protein [Micromonospora sp. CA-248260]|uniref:nitroreductase family protein n=1 Tax=Micromonospora sp. CA-248260 TaxID=3239962 RepID=UPI003D8D8F9B